MINTLRVEGIRRKVSDSLVRMTAVCSCVLLATLTLTGPAVLMRVAFPLVASAVGLIFYLRKPITYIQFTLWIWILTPCVRRLVDWRFGFQDQNLVLVAPLLVTAIASFTVLYKLKGMNRHLMVPFVLCSGGVLFGFFSGIIHLFLHMRTQESFMGMLYGLMAWMIPILFAMHIALEWRRREEIARAVSNVYFWSLLLVGLYTLIQYVKPWPWDLYWLDNIQFYIRTASSFGSPTPFHLRVWGTLNSPGTFAAFILCGILLVTFMKTRFRYFALIPGYLALIIGMVRIIWISWFLGIILVAIILRSKSAFRMAASVVLTALVILPVLYIINPDNLSSRFSTLLDIRSDSSYQDRQNMYTHAFDDVFEQPSGYGLGQGSANKINAYVLDSGIIQLLYALGVQGTIFYAMGILFALSYTYRVVHLKKHCSNEFVVISGVLFFVLLLNASSGNVFMNFTGLSLWLFIGLLIQYLADQPAGEGSTESMKALALPTENTLSVGGGVR